MATIEIARDFPTGKLRICAPAGSPDSHSMRRVSVATLVSQEFGEAHSFFGAGQKVA